MFDTASTTLAANLSNHLLQAASWAREALQAHAGKSFLVRGPLGSVQLSIGADGLVQRANAEVAPEVRIALSASQWMRFVSGDKGAITEAAIEGDAEFAAALTHVAENLQWDYEEDLSRVVGDVAAHRIGQTLRQARAWRQDSAARTAQTFKEYMNEEQSMVVSRDAADAFAREVARLREALEALERRVGKL